jgi:hypothetical protein
MSGLGIMQRKILRRARGSFSVREIALRLYPTIDDTNLGAVRRAVRGLEASGYLVHEPLPRPQAALARVNARGAQELARLWLRRSWFPGDVLRRLGGKGWLLARAS